MSNQPPRVYTGITPERFAQLSQIAESKGLNIPIFRNLEGIVNFHHCTFNWGLNQQTSELTIECLSHPFYIGLETIYEKLDELLKI